MAAQKEFRYERKYIVTSCSNEDVLSLLQVHPAMYSVTYPARYVNSLYFDTAGMRHFMEHINGIAHRGKIRIRWYGEETGFIKVPQLEFKNKSGQVGTKKVYPLPSFQYQTLWTTLHQFLKNAQLPPMVQAVMEQVQPTVFTRYFRYYFISADRRCRLTVDTDITFRRIIGCGCFETVPAEKQNITIIELKHNRLLDAEHYRPAAVLKIRVTGYSKYVQGVINSMQ